MKDSPLFEDSQLLTDCMPVQKSCDSKELVKSSPQKNFATGSFTVTNEKGLHTRPSTELAKNAMCFKSKIVLIHRNVAVNAKSVLAILSLSATRGTLISIEADGVDAFEAVQSIIALALKKFYIQY